VATTRPSTHSPDRVRVATFNFRGFFDTVCDSGACQPGDYAAHFKAKSGDDPPRRLAEAQASSRIVNEVALRLPDAVVLLGGDLNDTPGSPPLDALVVDGGLQRLADDVSQPVRRRRTSIKGMARRSIIC
jgi:hypothetical protein